METATKRKYSTKHINARVRQLCEENGWEVFFNFNDKRKDGTRRLKYMRNGAPVDKQTKKKIISAVMAEFADSNFISVDWLVGMRQGYGPYDYLCIVVLQ